MSQKFCKFLVTSGTSFCQGGEPHWTVRCQAGLPLTKFASISWSMASESIVSGLPDPAWLLRFLKPKQDFLNHLVTVLGLVLPSLLHNKYFCLLCPVQNCKVHKLYCIAYSSVRFSNHAWSETMHNVSVHQIPLYYQSQWIPTTAWTALVT